MVGIPMCRKKLPIPSGIRLGVKVSQLRCEGGPRLSRPRSLFMFLHLQREGDRVPPTKYLALFKKRQLTFRQWRCCFESPLATCQGRLFARQGEPAISWGPWGVLPVSQGERPVGF